MDSHWHEARIISVYSDIDNFSKQTRRSRKSASIVERWKDGLTFFYVDIALNTFYRFLKKTLSFMPISLFFERVNKKENVKKGFYFVDIDEKRKANLKNPTDGFRLPYPADYYDDIILTSETNCKETYITGIQIPRDIMDFYCDRDRDFIRKVELDYSVSVFWGRDFERSRDRDSKASPRGNVRICVYGRYENMMDAKEYFFRLVQTEGEYLEEIIWIPAFAAGNVIGRRGGCVAGIEMDAGARIDVLTREEEGDKVKVLISGRLPARKRAHDLINNCVFRSERMMQREQQKENIRNVRQRILGWNEEETEDNDRSGQADQVVNNASGWGEPRRQFSTEEVKPQVENEIISQESPIPLPMVTDPWEAPMRTSSQCDECDGITTFWDA